MSGEIIVAIVSGAIIGIVGTMIFPKGIYDYRWWVWLFGMLVLLKLA